VRLLYINTHKCILARTFNSVILRRLCVCVLAYVCVNVYLHVRLRGCVSVLFMWVWGMYMCVCVCVRAVEFAPHRHSQQVFVIVDLPSRACQERAVVHDGSRGVFGAGCLPVLSIVCRLSQTHKIQH